MIKLTRILLALWCMLMAPWALAAAPDDVVGMVLDLQGNGELVRKGESGKLQLLNYVKLGAQIKLDAGAKVSVSHYGAKLIYQLTGPALAQVEAGQIKVIKGAPALSKSLAEKLVVAALNPNMAPAAFKMRGGLQEISILAPGNRTGLLSTRPSFKWEADEATIYQIVLDEQPEHRLVSAKVDASSWELPAELALEYGKSYRWSVSYTSAADGKVRSASAVFSLASQAEAADLLAMKPAAGADIEEWVLYASVLQDRRMLDDARDVWRQIAARRPDLAKAQSLAR